MRLKVMEILNIYLMFTKTIKQIIVEERKSFSLYKMEIMV